ALAGVMRLTSGRLDIDELRGKRGEADVAGRGSVSWALDELRVSLTADARNLSLDDSLYQILPAPAQRAWDQVRPKGTVDASLTYSGIPRDDGSAGGFQLVLQPRELSATPTMVPYRLDQLAGKVTVLPDRVSLEDMTARHGDGRIRFSATGAGVGSTVGTWDFSLSADAVTVDEDLLAAIPPALSDVMRSLRMRGVVGFDFTKLSIASTPTTQPSSPDAPPPLDVDFAMTLRASGASMDVGVPLEKIEGKADFTGLSRGGKLAQLKGAIDIASLNLSSYPVSNLRAQLLKPADAELLRIDKLEADLASGKMAGQVECQLTESGPASYAAGLILRNADVKQLTGESAPDLRGSLSASFAIEGVTNDTATRRGRGDVSVNGQQMYRIPLLLGLLQITNLSLPITSPFSEAAARYSIEGNRVTFENIEMRSKEMLMQGTGHMDFGTRQVRMTFVTDNTTWPKVPIIGELIQGARHELLQIHVKGTIQEPKVSAGTMGTFTTTVDEVFRGEEKK
ncbi:MAG: hypothetical protein ACREJC_04385, partial [Tepidisphaeraceae bacterium]